MGCVHVCVQVCVGCVHVCVRVCVGCVHVCVRECVHKPRKDVLVVMKLKFVT